MSLGSVTTSGPTPGTGAYQHGATNYFCRWCGGYTSVKANAPDPKKCATPGCRRPDGFGIFAKK